MIKRRLKMDENKSSNLTFILAIVIAVFLYFVFLNKAQKNEKEKTTNSNMPLKERTFKGKDIKIDTETMIITFNSEGGIIRSIKLKNYREDKSKDPVELIPKNGFFLNTIGNNLDEKLNNEILEYSINDTENRVIVKFVKNINNETFEKKYSIDKNNYTMELEINGNNRGIMIGPKIAPHDRTSSYSFSGPIVKIDNKVEELKMKKEKSKSIDNFKWIAWESLYFTVSASPENRLKASVIKHDDENYEIYLYSQNSFKALLFVGPKDYYLLKTLGIEDNIRYGVFAPISKLLLAVMHFFYKIIPNWGVSIILLTVFVKILLHPLTVKGYKSMNKLRELQPEIQRIKEMYKDDPAKLNQAMMELYKKHKINPFGGCLPLFLQIPVFFALYKTIAISIELRHAPFILWLTDLSSKDPYYLTPIVMGITMFIQQLITSTPDTDGTQKMMTYGMPILLTIIFLNLPSGLVLYFLVNNIISIFEQLAIKHVYK
jgi:YidC/Oxa1 family membrane protein insertase